MIWSSQDDLFGSLAIGVCREAAPADLPADVGRGRWLGPGDKRSPLGPQVQQHRLVDRMRRRGRRGPHPRLRYTAASNTATTPATWKYTPAKVAPVESVPFKPQLK
jgi:hypothetical protein